MHNAEISSPDSFKTQILHLLVLTIVFSTLFYVIFKTRAGVL